MEKLRVVYVIKMYHRYTDRTCYKVGYTASDWNSGRKKQLENDFKEWNIECLMIGEIEAEDVEKDIHLLLGKSCIKADVRYNNRNKQSKECYECSIMNIHRIKNYITIFSNNRLVIYGPGDAELRVHPKKNLEEVWLSIFQKLGWEPDFSSERKIYIQTLDTRYRVIVSNNIWGIWNNIYLPELPELNGIDEPCLVLGTNVLPEKKVFTFAHYRNRIVSAVPMYIGYNAEQKCPDIYSTPENKFPDDLFYDTCGVFSQEGVILGYGVHPDSFKNLKAWLGDIYRNR